MSEACIGCGKCQARCPAQAIPGDPRATRHGECLTCRRCLEICPQQAIRFSFGAATHPLLSSPPDPKRRALLAGGAVFLAGGGVLWSTAWGRARPDSSLLRPPGARPEEDFLRRCLGCGACMAVCPTNTLQPAGFQHPWQALLSPLLTPVIGPCATDCNRCGQACPTEAILPLPMAEKFWARPGTAHIRKGRCLAWLEEKACLVCDEVCPFDAIRLIRVQGLSNSVPEVIPNRCAGCGYCEHECPAARKAIVVEAVGALRLNDPRPRENGLLKGLDIRLHPHQKDAEQDGVLPGGFPGGLPPGFTP
ncbi:MAG: 4Fe-4S binding protein [Deltaproteobacteria bacterium]|nr:4Fe-4S binding protein [Deltaproteobacteria bacterium]